MTESDFPLGISSKVLEWAIQSSGMKEEEVARRSKVPQRDLECWLKGQQRPNLKQLERLAKVLRRPLAAFLLSEPPSEMPPPKDFRSIPGREGMYDRRTLLVIRRARNLKSIARELLENIGLSTKASIRSVRLTEDPIRIAKSIRQDLGFDDLTQRSARNGYTLFNHLRNRIESKNILVFQFSMPINDARGFTLIDDTPFVIVVNTSDRIEPRIFSLLHELGHILLCEGGVSLSERSLWDKNRSAVERWCNDFASEVLLPNSIASMEFEKAKTTLTESGTLGRLSKAYKVSKAMLLYKMKGLRFISSSQLEIVLKRYVPSSEAPQTKKGKKKGYGAAIEKRLLNERGQMFIALVSKNIDQGAITQKDALDYLSVKTDHLEKVLGQVKK